MFRCLLMLVFFGVFQFLIAQERLNDHRIGFNYGDSLDFVDLNETNSGNPFITHIRGADPSAHVWNDGKVWVYASHDMDWASDYSSMDGYHVYSSYDLVSWTDHGEILHSRDVSWGNAQGGFMFAPSAAFKDGNYYLYFPHLSSDWKWRVGVASSTKAEGPFQDLGYIDQTDEIDPCCFMDDDGQAYLIWGGGGKDPKMARLRENMIELAEEPRIIEYGGGNFGEGPYMHKYNGKYYFSYTCNTCGPEQAFYSISDSPYGPFEYKGPIKDHPPGAQDHHSMIEYHGQWYYFYHTGDYGDDASLFRRNLCVDSMFYRSDGSIKEVIGTAEGVSRDTIGKTLGIRIPGRFEAENYFRQKGLHTVLVNDSLSVVTDIDSADYLEYVLEVPGSDTYEFTAKVIDPVPGMKVFLLADDHFMDTISLVSGEDTLRGKIFFHKGKHTLKLQFENTGSITDMFRLDWLSLENNIKYYSITASASAGGTIKPSGTIYIAEGESQAFSLDWETGFMPDSYLYDGQFFPAADTIIPASVDRNTELEVLFTKCTGISLAPLIFVNNQKIDSVYFQAYKGQNVSLSVNYEGNGALFWQDPAGMIFPLPNLELHLENAMQSGIYTAFLTNEELCKSSLEIEIKVDDVQLKVYEAEDWEAQSGVQIENASDIGGGNNIAFVENNDWSSYLIGINKHGIYDLIARVATASSGGNIEVSINDSVVGLIAVEDALSDGWQDWYTTEAIEVELEKGINLVKFTYRGGEGFLFNFNWFDLEFKREIPILANYISLVDPALQWNIRQTNRDYEHASPENDYISEVRTVAQRFKGSAYIDGKQYYFMEISIDSLFENWTRNGWFFREDSMQKKVYSYYDGKEELLYDFSLAAGDTMRHKPEYTILVDSVSTVFLAGEERKVLYLNIEPCGDHYKIIEGIGHLGRFDAPFYYCFIGSVTQEGLQCFYKDDKVILQNYETCYIYKNYTDLSKQGYVEKIQFYPNPLTETLFLKLDPEYIGAQLRLYSSDGRLLLSELVDRSFFQISFEVYEKGIYVASLEHSGGIYQQQILKL